MRKSVAFILIALAVVLTNVAQFLVQYNQRITERTMLSAQIAEYKSYVDQLGPMTTCYTVTGTTKPGQEITADCLQKMDVPASCITAAHITDATELLGRYFKISLYPGTPITADTVMYEPIPDSLREVDMVVCRWPVGLAVGDYLDLRITYPMGQDFIVLSHMRVHQVNEQSIKVHLDEAQWHRYQAALVDYYLNSDQGADIYVSKYVEPGIQEAAKPYYSVPEGIAAIMVMDPNITNKAEAQVNAQVRNEIQSAIDSVTDIVSGALQSGRSEFNGKVNNDYNQYASEHDQQHADGSTSGDWTTPVVGIDPGPADSTVTTPTPDYSGEGVIE